MPDLVPVYDALRTVMEPFAAKLGAIDTGLELHVNTRHVMKNGKPLFFGAVQLRKAYVSFHLMPVYVRPSLLDPVSPALRKRMHGKSCFNFAAVEPALFEELASLAARGYASYQEQGFV